MTGRADLRTLRVGDLLRERQTGEHHRVVSVGTAGATLRSTFDRGEYTYDGLGVSYFDVVEQAAPTFGRCLICDLPGDAEEAHPTDECPHGDGFVEGEEVAP